MRKRKLLSMLITCMLIVSMLPLSAFAAMGDTPVRETESNNTMETANVIANGETAGGALTNSKQERDPVDYWAVTLDTKSSLRVTFTSESSSLTALILNGEGEKLAEVAVKLSPGIGKEELETENLKTAEVGLAAGTYYIAVGDTKTGALTSSTYIFYVETEHVHTWEQTGKDMLRLQANFKCTECDETKKEPLTEVSEYELNDGAQWAVEATFKDVYYGDVENSEACSDLEDWYKITVDERSKIIVDARSVSAVLKLSLLDESENVLKEGADDRFGITGRGYIYSMAEFVPAGTYYVVVGLTEEAERTEYHVAVTAVPVEEEPPAVENDSVYRIAGSGRYETGFAVANELKEVLGVEKFEAAVVATGKNFADALAGSYLAVRKNAPILLTNEKETNIAALHTYIKENVTAGGTIYILGGTAAVPANVETIENDGYIVKRLAGASRYDTNLEILTEAGVEVDEIIVATGKTFADSLSASAAKLPILLVKPDANLNDAQRAVLAGMNNIYIVGGTGAVSAAYADELEAFGTVTRVFGEGRYQTSVEVAKTFCGDVSIAVVASGKNFPDGLCGGPLAAALNAPLVLTKDGSGDIAADYVTEETITGGYVLGGDGALADDTVITVFGLENADKIIVK